MGTEETCTIRLDGKPFVTERQMMAEEKTRRGTSQREAVDKVRAGDNFAVNLPFMGQVTIPRPEQLAYYGGLAGLVALELIDWPVALVIATGHVLANNHHNRLLEELGEERGHLLRVAVHEIGSVVGQEPDLDAALGPADGQCFGHRVCLPTPPSRGRDSQRRAS